MTSPCLGTGKKLLDFVYIDRKQKRFLKTYLFILERGEEGLREREREDLK